MGIGPDNLGDFYPDWVNDLKDEDLRPEILQLGKVITDRAKIKLGLQKITKYDPEYWAVANLAPTKEIAELALSMGGIRKPKTFKELLEITGLDEKTLEERLEKASWTGLLEWNYENEAHEKQWVLPMFVPGSAEFSNMNQDFLAEHPEMGRFFERMSRLPLEGLTHMVPPGGAGIGMHVIPVEDAISMEQEAIGLEKISYWLDKYEGKYAKSPCSCRLSRKTYDEGCADDPEGWCIAVGDMADYVVETNKGGVYITKEEALDIFKQAEDNGFVHQITNIDGENKIFAICNCNVNVCYALRTSQLFNTPNMSRSAYVAHVTAEDCVACGKCVENCPAGAVKLGQKLCKADGSQVEYPKQVLPTERKWSTDEWNDNYRDTNRINCYDTGTAPCKTACPAHIAIQGYLRMAAQGRYKEALALIKQDNPLPAICGRVCNRRCEAACTRGTIDEAIAIDEVKRFLAEMDLKSETRYIPKKIVPSQKGEFTEKVAIIGAGPAGLSCAYFLALKGYKPTIFEKSKYPGGMLRYGIPSFVLENNVIDAEIEIIKELGVEIKCGVEVGKDISLDELRSQGYKAFYVAIGCQGGNKPGVPGDDAIGTATAVDFLHECSENEKYDIKGDLVVIGGGNVAIDVARSARRVGNEKVSMFCLESRDIMPASPEEIEIVEAEGVELNCGWGPKEVLVDEAGAVKGIVLKKCTRVKDETGRFSPQYDENDTITVECKHVIFSVGQRSVYGDLFKGSKVVIERGPKADALTYQTDEPDIFVGGDMYTGPRFAIDAIAAGREGAISIHRFVQPHSSLTIGRNRRDFIELDKENIKIGDYDHSARQIPGVSKTTVDGELTFRDKTVELTEEQIKKETARCLKCGASVVDENKCIGCGVCTTKCEFDAIKLYREHPECSKMTPSEDKLKYVLPNGLKQRIKVAFKHR
ncbi:MULTISPECIES: FAD-dependent oxidoreductase [Pseudobutyrivibrio]|uniref:NADPH-dependent glutamate synthase beta chain n=1 Tax=Pseudobutyrivibrio ruminis DSM 9787 TaxID=1123011 RepID=A0A285S493_9FIRM|nr:MULTISPECIES: FAD-dependent oxidoreductase [Pseudobutyrivibrio]SES94647.1 NADPH-dependent glutamate synthase beta chain [Pseudobutyrivibrio sp. C4]SOC01318.1 NADPH-dependent glutamate synthase beta chain [Pseudobutyrivibrio ruminis DSM 9787]